MFWKDPKITSIWLCVWVNLSKLTLKEMVTELLDFFGHFSTWTWKNPLLIAETFLHYPARKSVPRSAEVFFSMLGTKASSKSAIQENKRKIPHWGEQQWFWTGEWEYHGKHRSGNRCTPTSFQRSGKIPGWGRRISIVWDRYTMRETYSRPDFEFSQWHSEGNRERPIAFCYQWRVKRRWFYRKLTAYY